MTLLALSPLEYFLGGIFFAVVIIPAILHGRDENQEHLDSTEREFYGDDEE